MRSIWGLLCGYCFTLVVFADVNVERNRPGLDQVIREIKVLNTMKGTEEEIIGQGQRIRTQLNDVTTGHDEFPAIKYVAGKLENAGELALFIQLIYSGTELSSYTSVLPALRWIVENKFPKQGQFLSDGDYRNYLPNYKFVAHRHASYRTAGYLRRDDIHLQVVAALYFYSAYIKKEKRELYYNDQNWRNEVWIILRKIILSPHVSPLALENVAKYSSKFLPLSFEDYMTILRRVDPFTVSGYHADPAFYVVVALRDNPNPTFNNQHLYALATVAKDREKNNDPLANVLLEALEEKMTTEEKVRAIILQHYYNKLGML